MAYHSGVYMYHKIRAKYGIIRISRQYAYTLALYRANSLLPNNCNLKHFLRFHELNTVGKAEYIRRHGVTSYARYIANNGWASGQWALRTVTEMVIEDVQKGNACKYEFIRSGNRFRRYWEASLNNIAAPTWFPSM